MSDPMSERYKLTDDELRILKEGNDNNKVKLPNLTEESHIDASDMACFSEIRAVLEKHNKLEKFGISLLHQHFNLKDGEVLFEKSDESNRTMTIEPKIIDSSDIDTIDTQWYLGKAMPLALVKCRTSYHQ